MKMRQKKKVETKTIKQIVLIPGVSPRELYGIFMDSKKHAAFTGDPAKISPKVGGSIRAADGWITGKNLKLVPGRLIIQQWRGDDWPRGHFSKAMFLFTKAKKKGIRGAPVESTKLIFGQTNVPLTKFKDISSGWHTYYWKPLAAYIRKHRAESSAKNL